MDALAQSHASSDGKTANCLLASLPPEDFARLAPHLRVVPLRVGEKLRTANEPITDIYFLSGGVVSVMIPFDDGHSIEIAMIGREGCVGIENTLRQPYASADVVVRVSPPADTYRMSADVFARELRTSGVFAAAMTEYAQRFLSYLAQSVAYAGLHPMAARCCRWLLESTDRLAAQDVSVTHESLSELMGVRRPTVSLIMEQLSREQIVDTRRGAVRILDRPRLQGRSCECYTVTQALFAGLRCHEASHADRVAQRTAVSSP